MTQDIRVIQSLVPHWQRHLILKSLVVGGAGALYWLCLLAGVSLLDERHFEASAPVLQAPAPVVAVASPKPVEKRIGSLLVDLKSHMRKETAALEPSPATAPAPLDIRPALPPVSAPGEMADREAPTPPLRPLAALPQSEIDAPQPPRRPGGLSILANRAPEPNLAPVAPPIWRLARQQPRQTVVQGQQPDNRNFLERLFGISQPSTGQALAYAPANTGPLTSSMRSVVSAPASRGGFDRYTAIYDISAHTVYLPSGQRLEAHSGLREALDDARYVSQRMRGPTPPNLYELTPRETLFHGVPALRLTPVGGGTVYGRSGLLAHTYMLGPNGDFNGCVSFRDYGAFLRAYQNGEVRRLAVVARMN